MSCCCCCCFQWYLGQFCLQLLFTRVTSPPSSSPSTHCSFLRISFHYHSNTRQSTVMCAYTLLPLMSGGKWWMLKKKNVLKILLSKKKYSVLKVWGVFFFSFEVLKWLVLLCKWRENKGISWVFPHWKGMFTIFLLEWTN